MQASRRWLVHLAVGVGLAAFVAALYFPLLFTNRVLATGDILLYFYPYREFVAAALREGRLPFWNPYLFGGAPLLANPQAAVLYPLHWPLIGLPVAKQVTWSAAIHTWLLGYGGYWLLRRWGYSAWAGLVTGVVLAGSGLIGGLIGHLNQLNVAAWLPWAVLCVEGVRAQRSAWPGWLARAGWLGVLVALMLLAGHTQTVYIGLFGLGIWVVWPAAAAAWTWVWTRRGRTGAAGGTANAADSTAGYKPALRRLAIRLGIYVGGVGVGALLAAPQLLPTVELSQLGLRTGGLDYVEATSFSLKPLQLLWTLLPTYGFGSLSAIFATPAYSEFVAYIGVPALALALLGAWRGRGPARTFGLLMVVLGLALGLGRWNPVYWLLVQVVPGFDLFRVPARWMLLYTLGAAVLAGVGVQCVLAWVAARRRVEGERVEGAQAGLVGHQPALPMAGTLVAVLLAVLVAGELLLAAQALPHTHPTAPEGVDGLRTAPAHLLTDPARTQPDPAAMGRFLGLSTITYDPGDMADYRRIMLEGAPPQLDSRTFDDLVIAQKVQELLVPNLALYWRIPTLDGFDGGVLPLKRFNTLAQLLIPADVFAPDGRLREQLQAIPPAGVLNLLDVQYLITDKVQDLWFEDIYYDRQIGVTVDGAQPQATLEAPGDFAATHIDLIGYAHLPAGATAGPGPGAAAVMTVTVRGAGGEVAVLPVTAGALGAGAADEATVATVAYPAGETGQPEYRVRLPLGEPFAPVAVELSSANPQVGVRVTAATLYDARTGMFAALLPSDRGRFARVHSGDVKIYENLEHPARAYVVTETVSANSPQAALALLQAQAGGPLTATASAASSMPLVTVVEDGSGAGVPPGNAPDSTGASGAGPARQAAEIVAYVPERVEVRTRSTADGLLVLADAYYPGWQATVDGVPAPIYPTNVLFRGVPVAAGEHTVEFTFEPTSWQLGLGLAVLGALLAGVLVLAPGWGRFLARPRGGV